METKIMLAGAIFVGGWVLYYLFGRQFVYNFVTAFPLIRGMNETQPDLIDRSAKNYTVISALVTGFICAVICIVVLIFCPLYLKICFAVGFIICAAMTWSKLSPDNREIFDSFCGTYYKFVRDDELRTAMYNKKPSQMKLRLHDMGLSTAFIPEFKKDGKNKDKDKDKD